MAAGPTTSMQMRRAFACAAAIAATLWPPTVSHADTVEDFYRGKQVVLLVASGGGGGYDTYARAFARHVGRHIPGNPAIIPKNLPAAGGLAAANTLYSVSPKDGAGLLLSAPMTRKPETWYPR